jgi:cyclopropane fatty-acyl-phospholipid synthase-like methyltransferase
MTVRDRLLGTSAGYSAFRRLIRADRMMTRLVREHFRVLAGERLLDVGCGTGDLARLVPGVEYVGVDHNAAYIGGRDIAGVSAANPTFINADVATLSSLDIGEFDIAVAVGVLHHVDDDVATMLIRAVREKLSPGGRFVTIDPVFHPDQRATARVLMALDRGRYVRHPADYQRLIASGFDEMTVVIRGDLNPFPYTHCIVEASVPRSHRSQGTTAQAAE